VILLLLRGGKVEGNGRKRDAKWEGQTCEGKDGKMSGS